MRAIFVPLGDRTLEALSRLARQERRHVKDQAAVLIENALQACEPKSGGTPIAAQPEQGRVLNAKR